MTRPRAYLAGPDVFLPDAVGHASRKLALCARHGIEGLAPINQDLPADPTWREIFDKCVAMMDASDLVIANLTPFRGASADSGTLVELGWFLGRGKPIFAYSNTATLFAERSNALVAAFPDPVPGLSTEGFGLADNLMIPGAVLAGGGHPIVLPEDGRDREFDALDVFERCVALAAQGISPAIT